MNTFSGGDSGNCHLVGGISLPPRLFTPIPVSWHVLTMTQVLFSDPWPCPFYKFLGFLAAIRLKQHFQSLLDSKCHSRCGTQDLVSTVELGRSFQLSQTSSPLPAESSLKISAWFAITQRGEGVFGFLSLVWLLILFSFWNQIASAKQSILFLL